MGFILPFSSKYILSRHVTRWFGESPERVARPGVGRAAVDGVGVRLDVLGSAEGVVHLEHALGEAHVVAEPRSEERRALDALGEEHVVEVVAVREQHGVDGVVRALQRRLKVGYSRAGRLTDEMEARGIVSAKDGSKPRKCLITREEWLAMQAATESA